MRMISTHRVYRGIEWLPCYCESTFDHNLGSEQWPAAVAEGCIWCNDMRDGGYRAKDGAAG